MLALPPLGAMGIPFLPTFCAADAGNEISETSTPETSANSMRDILRLLRHDSRQRQYNLSQGRLQNYFNDRASQECRQACGRHRAQELLSCGRSAASNH